MWLVNPRFDDQGLARTYHIRTIEKDEVDRLLKRAEKHGLTVTLELVEYAVFITRGTIQLKPMVVSNFHFYLDTDWHKLWEDTTPEYKLR